MAFAIGADIPRRQNKAAKECYQFLFHNLSNYFGARPCIGRVWNRAFRRERCRLGRAQPICRARESNLATDPLLPLLEY